MSWRTVAWSGIGYTVASTLLIHFIVPESPVWLVTKGRIEDAAKSLAYLYRKYPQPDYTDKPLSEMHLQILIRESETRRNEKMQSASKASFGECKQRKGFFKNKTILEFLKPTGYKPMMVLFFLFLIQQFSGIYITLFYAVTYFEVRREDKAPYMHAHGCYNYNSFVDNNYYNSSFNSISHSSFTILQEIKTKINPYIASIFVGMVRLIMSILNAWLLKRFKRRPLVMVSAAGMAACMFVSGWFTLWIMQGTTTHNWVPVVCLLLFVAFSMFGLLTIPWTMTAELFPTSIRGIAHSISYSTANILMFFAIKSYRPMTQLLGGSHAVQWFFAAVSLSGLLFALFFLPETHGKKLKDIEDHFMGKKAKAAAAAERDWMLTKGHLVVMGDGLTRTNSRSLIQKPSTKRGERKISRNSLSCVPEVEQQQLIREKEQGTLGGL